MPEWIAGGEPLGKFCENRARRIGVLAANRWIGSHRAGRARRVDCVVTEEAEWQCSPALIRKRLRAAMEHPGMTHENVAGLDCPRDDVPSFALGLAIRQPRQR